MTTDPAPTTPASRLTPPETCAGCDSPQDGTAGLYVVYQCMTHYYKPLGTWNNCCRNGWDWAAAHRAPFAALVAALNNTVAFASLPMPDACLNDALKALAAARKADTP
jgi:hypothetical protein